MKLVTKIDRIEIGTLADYFSASLILCILLTHQLQITSISLILC